jgi:hypothetical protein
MSLSRSPLALALLALLGACGGRTLDPIGDTPDSGVTTHSIFAHDAGVDVGIVTTGECVDVTVTPDELSCDRDSDCTGVTTGEVCADTCDCGGTAVNNTGANLIATQVEGLENGECACPAFGTPTCVGRVCTLCGFGPNPPAGCPNDCSFGLDGCDGGAPDTGIVDGGFDVSVVDAPLEDTGMACVDIDLATYSTTCQTADDCMVIQSGELCNGDCFCGGSTVSASEAARYNAAVASITPGACGCPVFGDPQCLNGQCVLCEGSNQPPACLQNGGNP